MSEMVQVHRFPPTMRGDDSLNDTLSLGKVLAESGMFKDARTAAQAVVKILAGRELGFPPIASLISIHMIEGKPTLGSHLLAAAIRDSGRYDFEILEHTDQVCAVRFTRKMHDGQWKNLEPVERLTLQEAVDKGWTANKTPWLKTPKNMLFARCLTNGHKFHCPNLFGGMLVYDADELDGESTNGIPEGGRSSSSAQMVIMDGRNNGNPEAHPNIPSPPPAPPPAPTAVLGNPMSVSDFAGMMDRSQSGQTTPAQEMERNLAGTEEPCPNPQATSAPAERLTSEEIAQVTALARAHKRKVAEVKSICAAAATDSLAKITRDKLEWLKEAVTTGLAPTSAVDRIHQLVLELQIPWDKFREGLRKVYQVESIAHLLPSQAAELLGKLISKKQQQTAAPAPAA